ncbi:MAG: DNA repair protein RecO [Candidatus Moraniibacteriota bacterium]
MDYRYTGIVLKKRKVGETDRLYTFYTREAGKIQTVAKGVRKPEAKLASSLETLSESEIMVVRTRGTGKVAGAILENSFAELRSDYATLASVLEAVRKFDELVDLEEADEKLYQLLRSFLSTVNAAVRAKKSDKVPLITETFFFQFLNHLGYQLELTHCVVTGEKLEKGEHFGVSPSAGGVVCENGMREAGDATPMNENAVKLLRLFSTQPIEKIEKLSIEPKDLAQISRFRKVFLQWVKH